MPYVSGLRSSYALTGGLVYFGRMLDKIRLHASGRLPADYHANLGGGFDARACLFLGIAYPALRTRTLAGGSDEEILAWCHTQGGPRTDAEKEIWNRFMMKIGWRDDRTPVLHRRIAEFGLGGLPIETIFDLNDFDEGRDPVTRRAWELKPARAILVMGVSGSGKTTVGRELARTLGWRLVDADDFHPAANVAKMRSGSPLTDDDRGPWLTALRTEIDRGLATDESLVVACSALKGRYRTQLIGDPSRVTIVHLTGEPSLLQARLAARSGHFMNPGLLDSQLADLEAPEGALIGDIALSPRDLVSAICTALPT